MEITVSNTSLEGVRLIEPAAFADERGFFFESYSKRRFAANGIDLDFVQDNHSRSVGPVIRGLHFQDHTAPQFRLVRCTVGEILDVVVDLRVGSPTLGAWMGVRLSSENRRQLLIPPEFAHGFATLSDVAEVQYKCSGFHSPGADRVITWNDPRIGIEWPHEAPILSAKDATKGLSFEEYLSGTPFKHKPTA